MSLDLFLFLFYLSAKVSLVIAAVVFFVSGIDDVSIDLYYLVRQTYRKLFVYKKYRRLQESDLLRKEEQNLAIFIPAWQEHAVIGRMLLNTINSLDYKRYHIFVGTYPNDDGTINEVEKVRQLYGNVTRIVCPHDGPTNKADNLNWIYQGMLLFEKEKNVRFAAVVVHDSEDVVHPLSLRLYNYLIPRFSMVQIPVLPLEAPLRHFTTGVYIDEFAENHTKDLLVRERIDDCIPSAGVGCAFSRAALENMAAKNNNLLFNTRTLTEDYEFGMRLRGVGGRQIFVRQALERVITKPNGKRKVRKEIIATRELFPSRFRAAVVQRSRWTLGIAIQGWRSLRWKGALSTKFMLYKDRKVLVTSVVCLVGYVAFFYFLADVTCRWWLGYSIFPPLLDGRSWLYYLIIADTVLMFHRLVFRVVCVGRLFGAAQAVVSIPRVFWANLVNFCSTVRAVVQFAASVITGRPVTWAKTDHEYPTEEQLRLYRRKLGDLLLERRFVTVQQIERGMEVQKQTGKPLGRVLIELGFLEEEDLMFALSKQSGIDYEDVRPYETDPELLREFPVAFLQRNSCFPVRRHNGTVVLATSELGNLDRVTELEHQLGRRIHLRLVGTSAKDIEFAISRIGNRLAGEGVSEGGYLGARLTGAQAITPEQLTAALRHQKRTGERLGNILVQQGAITRERLEEELRRGRDPRAESPSFQ